MVFTGLAITEPIPAIAARCTMIDVYKRQGHDIDDPVICGREYPREDGHQKDGHPLLDKDADTVNDAVFKKSFDHLTCLLHPQIQ